MQAKARSETNTNSQFQLNSVVFERDNLQMELEESLKQIDRLEQLNKSQINHTVMMEDNNFELGKQTHPDMTLQMSAKAGPPSGMQAAKHKHIALKLGVPSLDFTALK